MSRIKKAFDSLAEKNEKALIVFFTAGDPSIEKTIEFVLQAEKSGADIVEIGIPFSDPLAEGPVIQRANNRALANNIKVKDVFKMIEKIREVSNIPLVFLTYANPVHNFGIEKFFNECYKAGIDGIIIPDLPFEEKEEFSKHADKNSVDLISLIAPTSNERIEKIASSSKGFIYCVSSLGVTGVRKNIDTDFKPIMDSIKKSTNTPTAIGFGISTPEQAAFLKDCANGIIVGSAIVKLVEQYGVDSSQHLHRYISEMKAALL